MERLKRFNEIRRAEGVSFAIKETIRFIKNVYCRKIASLLPKSENASLNGVEVPNSERLPHLKYEKFVPFYRGESEPGHSGGEINAHKKFTRRGDDVVIIGGGRGVSAVRASHICSPGKVYVYEPSLYYFDLIKEVLTLNNVPNCEVIHGYIGPPLEIWGDSPQWGEKIELEDLPSCEILEMDCEGAEYQILNNLSKIGWRPRAIIVEVHPHHANKKPNPLFDNLKELGYKIEYRSSTFGKKMTEKKLNKQLKSLYNKRNEHRRNRPNPPIVGAVLED